MFQYSDKRKEGERGAKANTKSEISLSPLHEMRFFCSKVHPPATRTTSSRTYFFHLFQQESALLLLIFVDKDVRLFDFLKRLLNASQFHLHIFLPLLLRKCLDAEACRLELLVEHVPAML